MVLDLLGGPSCVEFREDVDRVKDFRDVFCNIPCGRAWGRPRKTTLEENIYSRPLIRLSVSRQAFDTAEGVDEGTEKSLYS